jgi:hypothetical protein
MSYTYTWQQIALANIQRVTAVPSIIGSAFVVQHIARNKEKRSQVYHRLLLMMCLMDVGNSIKTFLGTWPVPRGSPGSYGASGTTQTCTAQGFFGHGSFLSSALYNGSLAIFYVLTIRYGWSEHQVKKVEKYFHAVPLLIGWCTAIAGLPLTLFNSLVYSCWIDEFPNGCNNDPNTPCERGENAWIYRWAFFHVFVWSNFVFLAVCMVFIYRKVLATERATDRYTYSIQGTTVVRGSNVTSTNRARSKQVAFQALLYVGAYYLTWMWNPINYILISTRGKPIFGTFLMQTIMNSLPGAFNAAIYLRPRYEKWRRENLDSSFCTALWRSCCCCCRRSNKRKSNLPVTLGTVEEEEEIIGQGEDENASRGSAKIGSAKTGVEMAPER